MTRKTVSILLIVFVVLAIVIYTQLTIFVIQPIGAVPEGKTLVILSHQAHPNVPVTRRTGPVPLSRSF